MGTLVFSILHCRDFSFFSVFCFLFSFLRTHKKHKNANKRISYFFSLRCFLSAFFIFVRFFAICAFAWLCSCAFCLFGVFRCFWCFSCVQNLFVKNNKEFKAALITSFILLLPFPLHIWWLNENTVESLLEA